MIRYYITSEISVPQKKELMEHGYFVYDMRTADDGKGFTIELNVLVNHEGVIITDREIPLNETSLDNGHTRFWLNDDGFFAMDIEELDYEDLKDILSRNRNTNFHFHIKGKDTNDHFLCRTYNLTSAKEILNLHMKKVKEKDPSAKAYQFGCGKNEKSFWRICRNIASDRRKIG